MAVTTFEFQGKDYPIPSIDTFNLDEAMVLYHYSKLTLDQVPEQEGVHPGVIATMVHVGFTRANPAARFRDVEKAVRAVNLTELIAKIEIGTEEDDAADPPEIPLSEQPEQPEILPEPVSTGDDGLLDGGTPQEALGLRAIGFPESEAV